MNAACICKRKTFSRWKQLIVFCGLICYVQDQIRLAENLIQAENSSKTFFCLLLPTENVANSANTLHHTIEWHVSNVAAFYGPCYRRWNIPTSQSLWESSYPCMGKWKSSPRDWTHKVHPKCHIFMLWCVKAYGNFSRLKKIWRIYLPWVVGGVVNGMAI